MLFSDDIEEHVGRIGAVGELADLADREDSRVRVGRRRIQRARPHETQLTDHQSKPF
jgi:hypothetical protein